MSVSRVQWVFSFFALWASSCGQLPLLRADLAAEDRLKTAASFQLFEIFWFGNPFRASFSASSPRNFATQASIWSAPRALVRISTLGRICSLHNTENCDFRKHVPQFCKIAHSEMLPNLVEDDRCTYSRILKHYCDEYKSVILRQYYWYVMRLSIWDQKLIVSERAISIFGWYRNQVSKEENCFFHCSST